MSWIHSDTRPGRWRGSGDQSHLVKRLLALTLTTILVVTLVPFHALGRQASSTDLIGEYAVTITEDDIPLNLIGGPGLVGDWVIFFLPAGEYRLERLDVGAVVTGSYTIDGQTVTITDEAGVYSCGNPQQPVGQPAPTATYTWEAIGERLTLRPVEDECPGRRLIFTTRSLAIFVPCLIQAVEIAVLEDRIGNGVAPAPGDEADNDLDAIGIEATLDPIDQARADATATAVAATTAAELDDPEDVGTPVVDATDATPVATDELVPVGTADDPAEAIDDILAQLTACWATGDPLRVLPLFSPDLLNDLTSFGASTVQDLINQIRPLQTVPITWERAGALTITNDEGTEAQAIVALQIGPEEQFTTLQFVRLDEGWRFVTFLP